MAMSEWLRFRLLYIEYLFWAGLGTGGTVIAASLSASHPLTKETWLVALGLGLGMAFARMRQNPREIWEDAERERERKRHAALGELVQEQVKAAEAIDKVGAKIEEVKDAEPK